MGIVSANNRFSSNDAPLVSCLYVSGSDVYVGGMLHTGAYWKNGTANYLPQLPDGSFVPNIKSVFVVGNDVYSTGPILQLGNHTLGTAYWKNTVEQDLQVITPTSDVTTYTPTSVFVFGTDIYIAVFHPLMPPPKVLHSIAPSIGKWQRDFFTRQWYREFDFCKIICRI